MQYNETILVVEDDSNDQIFILEAFRSIGVDSPIHVLNSGSEAIEYLMGEGKYSDREEYAYPSFIMTDLKMPSGDGFFLLEQIRSNPEWSLIPRVILSSSDDPSDIKKSYMLGASGYHQKPLSQAELCDQLQILHDYWMTCKIPDKEASGGNSHSGLSQRKARQRTA